MSSVIAGIEIPNLSRRAFAFWMGVSAGVQLLVLAIPVFVQATKLEARVDVVTTRIEVQAAHAKESREADAIRDAKIAALEKAAELRGAQLDRIEVDVKELLRLAK